MELGIEWKISSVGKRKERNRKERKGKERKGKGKGRERRDCAFFLRSKALRWIELVGPRGKAFLCNESYS